MCFYENEKTTSATTTATLKKKTQSFKGNPE
jgi:hypothetical protein